MLLSWRSTLPIRRRSIWDLALSSAQECRWRASVALCRDAVHIHADQYQRLNCRSSASQHGLRKRYGIRRRVQERRRRANLEQDERRAAGQRLWLDSITMDPFHPDVLYAWLGTGGYVSRDGASSWTPSSLPLSAGTSISGGLHFSFDQVRTRGDLWSSVLVPN